MVETQNLPDCVAECLFVWDPCHAVSQRYKNICQLGFGGATTTTTLTSKPTTTVAPTTNTVIKSIQGKMTVLEQQLEDQIQASDHGAWSWLEGSCACCA